PDQALVLADGGIYRTDLISGAVTLDTSNPGDVVRWAADNALRVRAALAWTAAGDTELRVRDQVKAPWRVIQRWSYQEDNSALGFTADDRALLLTSSAGVSTSRLLRVDVETGTSTVLAEDPRSDVRGVLRHPSTGEVQAVKFIGFRKEWTLLDLSLRPDFDALRSICDGDVDISTRDRHDRVWTVTCEADTHPPVYYQYVRATRTVTPLFEADSVLDGRRLARVQSFEFRARDGLTVPGYLTLPAEPAPRDPLMVLLVHGGPWDRDEWGWDSMAQWLASRRYAVLQVNFRGSSGYGKAHLQAGDHEWG